jgi:hypothetical protein
MPAEPTPAEAWRHDKARPGPPLPRRPLPPRPQRPAAPRRASGRPGVVRALLDSHRAPGAPEAPTGRSTGGTGQAIRLAVAWGVDVLDLARPDHRARVEAELTAPTGATEATR